MEENFKKIIEEIKESTVDSQELKKYILAIKKAIERFYENCKDELSDEEIIAQFREDYEKDLEFRGDARFLYYNMIKYQTLKRLIQDYKGNKANFNSVVKEAKKMESEDDKDQIISLKADYKKTMISAVRYIIRKRKVTKESELINAIKEEKNIFSQDLRERMVKIIHESASMLDKYGILDEYIQTSNEELEKLGLDQLKYTKRNPLPDEQYDEQGNQVKDVEDIGVIDALSEEELEKISIEELEIMTAFFESKYLYERLGLSRAMSVIKTLDLWDDMIHKSEKDIETLDNDKIISALKKDLAASYMYKNQMNITNKMRRQYKKFLKKENLNFDQSVEEDIEEISSEMANLESAASDLTITEGLIIQQLKSKDIKIKNWGVIDRVGDEVIIAIENRNFRGPLVMDIPKDIVERFCEIEDNNLPQYKKNINEGYSKVMSSLYIPVSNFYKKEVEKAYDKNPESTLVADLAGKKAKSIGEER